MYRHPAYPEPLHPSPYSSLPPPLLPPASLSPRLKQSLVPSRASSFSEGTLALRYTHKTGMAAAWPLLSNLGLLLPPNERSLFLLSCVGASYEDGVRAHAWCGAAVWAWGTMHGKRGAWWCAAGQAER